MKQHRTSSSPSPSSMSSSPATVIIRNNEDEDSTDDNTKIIDGISSSVGDSQVKNDSIEAVVVIGRKLLKRQSLSSILTAEVLTAATAATAISPNNSLTRSIISFHDATMIVTIIILAATLLTLKELPSLTNKPMAEEDKGRQADVETLLDHDGYDDDDDEKEIRNDAEEGGNENSNQQQKYASGFAAFCPIARSSPPHDATNQSQLHCGKTTRRNVRHSQRSKIRHLPKLTAVRKAPGKHHGDGRDLVGITWVGKTVLSSSRLFLLLALWSFFCVGSSMAFSNEYDENGNGFSTGNYFNIVNNNVEDEEEAFQFYTSQWEEGHHRHAMNVRNNAKSLHTKGNDDDVDGGEGVQHLVNGNIGVEVENGSSGEGANTIIKTTKTKGMLQLGSIHSYKGSSYANSFSVSTSTSNNYYDNAANENGSSSIVTTTTTSPCPPTSCAGVATYDLLPVHPDCREYVLCQQFELTLTFSCPENMVFDARRKKCQDENEGECACVTSPAAVAPAADVDVDDAESSPAASMIAGIIGGGAATTMDANSLPAVPSQAELEAEELEEVCSPVERYEQLPLLSTGCRDYVSCVDGRAYQRQSCPGALLFDVGIRGCNWKDAVECPAYGGGSSSSATVGGVDDDDDDDDDNFETEDNDVSASINIGNISFGSNNNGNNDNNGNDNNNNGQSNLPTNPSVLDGISTKTEKDIVTLAQEEAATICLGQSYTFIPLPTTGCKYYVYCQDNKPASINACTENQLFDISFNGCNWDYNVDCPTASPTPFPTDRPTMPQPTNEPTTKRPTQRPSKRPTTNRPTSEGGPRPTPPPTPRPTFRPTPAAPPPDLFEWLQDHQRELNQEVFRSYTKAGQGHRSYWFQFQDFYGALKLMSGNGDDSSRRGGIPGANRRAEGATDGEESDRDGTGTGSKRNLQFGFPNPPGAGQISGQGLGGTPGQSITGDDKHIFYVGSDDPSDWEYGLVNIAAFLAHAMTESITNDACDEFHWESNSDADASTSDAKTRVDHYALSNACGQDGMNYQEFYCSEEEKEMQCEVDRNLRLQATTSAVYPNAPPPLSCGPRSTGNSFTGFWDVLQGKEIVSLPYENSYGRTDVEGCCYWGRGAIHSKGVCNLGKINYYLGKKASSEGRRSRYPNMDFCANPELICTAPESREMRWVTSMFEWTERVQAYDDGEGWNYMRKLKDFVDYGLVDFEFLEATGGILTQGCHDPPCAGSSKEKDGGWGSGSVHLQKERVQNFKTVLVSLEAGGEEALLRALIKYFTDRQDTMNSQVLRSQTPQGQLYPSYRYQLPDFLKAVTYISETGVGGRKFYIGEPRVPEGVRYGVVNAILFLAQAYKEAIQYDACDENNWELVNDRFPISNSCGQLGMSYQDMHCKADEAFMECPVDRQMEQVALTSALWFQAPAPLKCGPKSTYPTTGFWDYDAGREDNGDAYANGRGRVDVEGCCWWGRGILQTRGTCNYGKLNYFLGKRASDEGRPSLYPEIDFCKFPQGVCSSDATYGGELQWMVGLFEWADRIQTYNVGGWNYMEKLKAFTDGGYKDFAFVDAVSGILNIGCHDPPCVGYSNAFVQPHNKRDRNDTFQRMLNALQVARTFRPPPKPTPMPSPVPTENPTEAMPTTGFPTTLDPPTDPPTFTASPTTFQGRAPDEVVIAAMERLKSSEVRFTELVLLSDHPSGESWPSYLYTFKGFLLALEKMTSGVGPGEKNFFYVGDGYPPDSVDYGLVNIAAFVAQGIVESIKYDACDENNWETINFRYPISNSCGQGGKSYQDDVCREEIEKGMECEVDPNMEIYGVTHSRKLGAPPPMYCADRSVGFWDHTTGLEEHALPTKNKRGRSDIKGCCWWGRGVLQVRGVCAYGKLNHWLGAKAAREGRPSIYPDIDFCKNPGAICSDKRSNELRWVTGMFHWVQTVQRSREHDYFPTLKRFVENDKYAKDPSFIDMLNTMLGGRKDEVSTRTKAFYDALRAFNLIKVETNTTETPTITYCGLGWNDGSRCTPCETNMDCTGLELCYSDMKVCTMTNPPSAMPVYIPTENDNVVGGNTTDNSTGTLNVTADVPLAMTMSYASANYCGETWGDAAENCATACPSGTNLECAPGHSCFGGISTCTIASDGNSDVRHDVKSGNTTDTNPPAGTPNVAVDVPFAMTMSYESTTNYCGETWGDAAEKCANACPSGTNLECAPGHFCFGDISTCTNDNNGYSYVAEATHVTSNYCGVDWSDAQSKCSETCPAGTDAECPPSQKCFGDIQC